MRQSGLGIGMVRAVDWVIATTPWKKLVCEVMSLWAMEEYSEALILDWDSLYASRPLLKVAIAPVEALCPGALLTVDSAVLSARASHVKQSDQGDLHLFDGVRVDACMEQAALNVMPALLYGMEDSTFRSLWEDSPWGRGERV
jgi:hypothetical protein